MHKGRKYKDPQQWIAFVMALATVALAAATIYFGHQQAEGEKRLLSVQLAVQFNQQFETDKMLASRKALARALLKGKEPPEDDVLAFFETMAFYVKQGVIDKEAVWNDFSYDVLRWWPVLKDYVKQSRAEEGGDKGFYDNFEWLYNEMLREGARRRRIDIGKATPSTDSVKAFLEAEANRK